MEDKSLFSMWNKVRLILKAHPWHGIFIGKHSPAIVTAFIEIVPTDTVKYELDKQSGYIKIDRPQLYSNVCPTPYGLIPQTYCGEEVAKICMLRTGRVNIKGDGDPLDICVITEKVITHNDVLLQAVPIGGLRLLDGNEADDKIIAVMQKDSVFGDWNDISDVPKPMIERLKHYFLTYKEAPESENRICELDEVYGREAAYEVIDAAQKDYLKEYEFMNNLLLGKA